MAASGRPFLRSPLCSFHHPAFAIDRYNRILAKAPDHIEALVGLSRLESNDRALRFAGRAYELDPTHPAAAVRMAEMKVFGCQAGRIACGDALPEAISLYTRALDSETHAVVATYGLGIISLYVQRPDDALEYLRTAHARAPWSPQINFYLGEAYGQTGARDRARVHLKKTAYWHPDESWRSKASEALDRLDEARKAP